MGGSASCSRVQCPKMEICPGWALSLKSPPTGTTQNTRNAGTSDR